MSERYLVDTHVLLWAFADDPRLSRRHRDILGSDAEVLVSVASIWEMSIKISLGKLEAFGDIPGTIERAGYRTPPILARHAEAVRDLPWHHRDPFDRILVAQARHEGLRLLTVDPVFRL